MVINKSEVKKNLLTVLPMCVVAPTEQAFVTLATSDNYARGAMVLGKSLRKHDTSKKLVVLIAPEVSEPCQ